MTSPPKPLRFVRTDNLNSLRLSSERKEGKERQVRYGTLELILLSWRFDMGKMRRYTTDIVSMTMFTWTCVNENTIGFRSDCIENPCIKVTVLP